MIMRDTFDALSYEYEPNARRVATVLVVDDDDSIRDVLREYLEDEGFSVVVAKNGAEALQRARAERPDLIISDVLMPRLDGYGLLEQVRQSPELAGTPLVLMSCIPPRRSRERPNAYLRKPFDLGGLISLIHRIIPVVSPDD